MTETIDITEYQCMADDCTDVAEALIQTDDDVLVTLCRSCHAEARTRLGAVTVHGHTLILDDAGSWFFLPEERR